MTAEFASAPRATRPREIRGVRFRALGERRLTGVKVNGKSWKKLDRDWAFWPGDIGTASIVGYREN